MAESEIPRSCLVIHLKAGHAQLNQKSAISGLQIGSFQGRSFHDCWSRGTKTLGTRVPLAQQQNLLPRGYLYPGAIGHQLLCTLTWCNVQVFWCAELNLALLWLTILWWCGSWEGRNLDPWVSRNQEKYIPFLGACPFFLGDVTYEGGSRYLPAKSVHPMDKSQQKIYTIQ